MAVRSSAIPPHSSQSSSPGSSSALPAATISRTREPSSATGPVTGVLRSSANPASDGRSSTSKRSPVSSRTGGPATAAQPSRDSYQCRVLSVLPLPVLALPVMVRVLSAGSRGTERYRP